MRAQTLIFTMTVGEVQANPNTMTGTMIIFGTPTRVLFDFRSSRLFVSTSFALHVNRELSSLKHTLVVTTLLREQILRNSIFKGCEILIEGVVLKASLIPLKMWDFDVILIWIDCPLIKFQWIILQRRLCFGDQDFQSWNLRVTVEFFPCV